MRSRSPRQYGAGALLLAAAVTLATGCSGGASDTAAERDPHDRGAADPRDVDKAELERLRALGYVGVGAPLAPDAPVGVLAFDRERARPGLNMFTNAMACSTQLMDMEGRVVHEWSYEPCFRWVHSVLLAGGDLLLLGRLPHDREDPEAIREARYLMRMTWDGEVLWRKQVAVHHDLELAPDGRILSLTYERRTIPEVSTSVPVRDHAIVLFSANGDVEEEVSLWEILSSAPEVMTLSPIEPREAESTEEIDLIHANSVEWMRDPDLARRHPLYGLNNILVCLRNQDTIVIIDWESKRPVWAWGRGELFGPHDATVLPDGNILVFDNGLGRGWSRVVEVDPIDREIVWEYRAEDPRSFYTKTRGANQRLANGNTLISESDNGRVFEVTPAGETVWEFLNFNVTAKREPSVITRMRRFDGLDLESLLRLIEAGETPPRVD